MAHLIYRYKLGTREGLLVKVEGAGYGEIAPLPGWSRETLEDVLQELKSGKIVSPSVQFGLESALLSSSDPLSLPICPLLTGSAEEILQAAERVSGSLVKVKLGDLRAEKAIDILRELRKKFHLRVDLNRKWALADSLKVFSHFSQTDFDFIEEPCQNARDLHQFPFPIGADESLRDTSLEELLKIPHLKALVFKPTLMGGMRVGKMLADVARRHQLDLIFSACFESGIGIARIAHMAQALGVPIRPLGLDTYRYLEDDVLQNPLDFSEGYLHLRPDICSAPLLKPQNVFPEPALLKQMNFV